jgi:hypothetical protein
MRMRNDIAKPCCGFIPCPGCVALFKTVHELIVTVSDLLKDPVYVNVVEECSLLLFLGSFHFRMVIS